MAEDTSSAWRPNKNKITFFVANETLSEEERRLPKNRPFILPRDTQLDDFIKEFCTATKDSSLATQYLWLEAHAGVCDQSTAKSYSFVIRSALVNNAGDPAREKIDHESLRDELKRFIKAISVSPTGTATVESSATDVIDRWRTQTLTPAEVITHWAFVSDYIDTIMKLALRRFKLKNPNAEANADVLRGMELARETYILHYLLSLLGPATKYLEHGLDSFLTKEPRVAWADIQTALLKDLQENHAHIYRKVLEGEPLLVRSHAQRYATNENQKWQEPTLNQKRVFLKGGKFGDKNFTKKGYKGSFKDQDRQSHNNEPIAGFKRHRGHDPGMTPIAQPPQQVYQSGMTQEAQSGGQVYGHPPQTSQGDKTYNHQPLMERHYCPHCKKSGVKHLPDHCNANPKNYTQGKTDTVFQAGKK